MRPSRTGAGVVAVWLLVALVLTACGAGGDEIVPRAEGQEPSAENVAQGRDLYATHCAACHGAALDGAATGPSLLDEGYAPSVFPDEAIITAITQGAEQRRWEFGPMPATLSLSTEDVLDVVDAVRSAQTAAGLE